jgi:hypothetical protein
MLTEKTIYFLLGLNDRQGQERPLIWHPVVIIGMMLYLLIALIGGLIKGFKIWFADMDSAKWRILP